MHDIMHGKSKDDILVYFFDSDGMLAFNTGLEDKGIVSSE